MILGLPELCSCPDSDRILRSRGTNAATVVHSEIPLRTGLNCLDTECVRANLVVTRFRGRECVWLCSVWVNTDKATLIAIRFIPSAQRWT